MTKRIGILIACCSLFVAGAVAPAAANDPSLRIHSDEVFTGPSTAEGTFIATGSAVVDDSVCGSGAASQKFAIDDSGGQRRVTGTEVFSCDDGSGSLTVIFEGQRSHSSPAGGQHEAVACLVGGTGAYEELRAVAEGRAWVNFEAGRVMTELIFTELEESDCPID